MTSPTSGFAKDLAKLYGFGCLGFIVLTFVLGYLMARSGSKCPPEVDSLVASPDSTREAVVFHFECGFGKKGTTNVSVQPAGAAVRYPANLFVVMDSSGVGFLLGKAPRPAVQVAWQDSTTLLVRYAAGARVVARYESVRGVHARFSEMAPPP